MQGTEVHAIGIVLCAFNSNERCSLRQGCMMQMARDDFKLFDPIASWSRRSAAAQGSSTVREVSRKVPMGPPGGLAAERPDPVVSVAADGTDADRRSADRRGGGCLTTGSMCSKPLTWERHDTFSGYWGRSPAQEVETWPTVGCACRGFDYVAIIRVSARSMCGRR